MAETLRKLALLFVGNLLLLIPDVALPEETTPPKPIPEMMTLERCIQLAIAASPDIESAESDTRVVEAKLDEARRSYILPELKLRVLGGVVPDVPDGSGAPNFPSVDTGFSDLGPFIQTRVEALQPIFTFGKLSGLKQAAQRGVYAKEAGERQARDEIVQRVKNVYQGLVYLYSLDEFIKELNDRALKAKTRVEELLRKHSPEAIDIDLMRMNVFISETARRIIELRSGVEVSLQALRILIGYPPNVPIQIADRMVKFRNIEIKPVEQYLAIAQQNRPELRQIHEAVAVRKALYKAQKADYFPMIFVGGYWGYGKAPGREDVDNPFLSDDFNINSGGAALGLQQNLAFHITAAKYEQAQAEYLKALADEKRVRRGVEIEVRKMHGDLVAKHDSVQEAENGFKSGRSWVTATTIGFGVGLTPVKDILEAFVAYSKVKVGFLDTIHAYDDALANLSRAVGQELGGFKY